MECYVGTDWARYRDINRLGMFRVSPWIYVRRAQADGHYFIIPRSRYSLEQSKDIRTNNGEKRRQNCPKTTTTTTTTLKKSYKQKNNSVQINNETALSQNLNNLRQLSVACLFRMNTITPPPLYIFFLFIIYELLCILGNLNH